MKKLITILILLVTSIVTQAQIDSRNDSIITTYLHINADNGNSKWTYNIIQFTLTNIDSLGKPNWESKKITEFEKEDDYYFVKVNIPISVLRNSRDVWCEAIGLSKTSIGFDTIIMDYGGVKLSKIELFINSKPEGAETYLISKRIWEKQFSNVNLVKDDARLRNFKVNTKPGTNTSAFIDETVFVVLFEMNGVYKHLIHKPRPFNVEPQQTVWIKF